MGEFVTLEVEDGVGTIRLARPPMNALSAQLQEEIRAAAHEAAERSDVAAVVVYGGPKVFAAGADVKEMATWSYQQMVDRSSALQSSFTAVARIPKPTIAADDRLRPRRRVRARAVLRPAGRRRQRQARPARDPARHHPRCRRHAAAVAARRPVSGQGAHLHRALRRRRGGAAHRPGRPRGRAGRRLRRGGGARRVSSRPDRRTHCARRRRRSTAASRSTSTPGSRSSGCSSRRCSRPRTEPIGMASFIELGPGKATFTGR